MSLLRRYRKGAFFSYSLLATHPYSLLASKAFVIYYGLRSSIAAWLFAVESGAGGPRRAVLFGAGTRIALIVLVLGVSATSGGVPSFGLGA